MATIPLPASVGNPFEPLERLHALHERGRTGGPLWLLDDFMAMGRATDPFQGYYGCEMYKHCMSRRYLLVHPTHGTLWVKEGRWIPRSYTHAIAWVLDGWTSAKMDEALSVYRGLRAELAKAVQP